MIARAISPLLVAGFVVLSALQVGAQTKPLTPSQMVDPKILVARIDTDCAVFRRAIATEQPAEVARIQKSIWKGSSDADVTTAKHAGSAVTFAKVWKQAGNYVWVHWVTHATGGIEHASQLCFRPDGTLARVRQATTIPGLDAASARQAYYNTDSSLIKRSALFAINDPSIYKHVKDLPFFNILP